MEMPTLLLAFFTVCYWYVLAGNRKTKPTHKCAHSETWFTGNSHSHIFVAILKVLGVWHKNGAEVHPACLLPKLSNPDPWAMEEMVWQVYEFSFTFTTLVWHFVNFKSTRSLRTIWCLCVPDESQLVSLVEACWSKVILERQRMLEETYKIEISASHKVQTEPVGMTDISPLWEEMARKAWLLHTG